MPAHGKASTSLSARKLAEELKIAKVELVPTETAQRVPFLVADTIDISLGGLTRNSERAKQIEFTFPAAHRSDGRADDGKGRR